MVVSARLLCAFAEVTGFHFASGFVSVSCATLGSSIDTCSLRCLHGHFSTRLISSSHLFGAGCHCGVQEIRVFWETSTFAALLVRQWIHAGIILWRFFGRICALLYARVDIGSSGPSDRAGLSPYAWSTLDTSLCVSLR